MSEVALFSHEAGRHFILNFGIYCSFHHDEAGFPNVFVLFGNCEQDEADINYNLWIYPQNSSPSMQAVEITI